MKASYIACGLTPRQHGNARRLPHNTLSFEAVKNVVMFLRNYAEDHAILLPGRIPGYKRDDVQLLPSSTTKKVLWCDHMPINAHHTHNYNVTLTIPQAVWVEYKLSCDDIHMAPAAYSTFTKLWRKLTPQIQAMKPMSDLCWKCQQNSFAIMRSANKPEEEKSDVCPMTKSFYSF